MLFEGFYTNLTFHRVIPGFMIQGGGFSWEGGLKDKKAPRTIKGEFAMNGVKNDLHHGPGVLSMARTMYPDSASSQFFICAAPCSWLDGEYAAFGYCMDEESKKVVLEVSNVQTYRAHPAFTDFPCELIGIKTINFIEE